MGSRADRIGWPASVWVVRHGESAGNVAREQAEQRRAALIDIAARDIDVPLSPTGREQSRALGRHLATLPERPTLIVSSPYARALETTELIVAEVGLDRLTSHVDERLREREFGVLDRLTRLGIQEKYPQEAERRRLIGKFYHRPPGGESWADVIARVRAVLSDLRLTAADERVLIVAHQVVALSFYYVIEELDEQRILAIDRQGDVANCSLTRFERVDSQDAMSPLRLTQWNDTSGIQQSHAPVTEEEDVAKGPR